jgi:hypothetical protein
LQFSFAKTTPHILLVITYLCRGELLIFILQTPVVSALTQHEVHGSLQRRLIQLGDNGQFRINDYLGNIISDDGCFFSLRCHAIHFPGTMLPEGLKPV